MSVKNVQTVPVVVGVTGHRAIRGEDRAALSEAVEAELLKLQKLCPNSPLVMLSSLAEGGDLLCADVAEKLGLPLIAALPRPREDYERDFSAPALERFSHHCARAQQVFVVQPIETLSKTGTARSFQFRQAGIYVAVHSHVLLAMWDGAPGTKAACGTAEAVDFALNGTFSPASGISVRSDSNEAVIHIVTPRSEKPAEAAGTVHVLGNRGAMEDVLRKTDAFNREAQGLSLGTDSRIPVRTGKDPILTRMETVSCAAGKLSRRSARRYRTVLGLLAAASALLTFAFLMYDEAQAFWMILVCGAMLLAAWSCRRYAVHSDCHRRYVEYRALAEYLRVQTYLRYAGSCSEASSLLSWTQQEETAWVLDALCTLTVGPPPEEKHDIRTCWVDAQQNYRRDAVKRAQKKISVSERTVQTALFFSVALYLAAVGFELLCGGLIFRPSFPVPDTELWRTILKILLGTISAVTLFVANYYGRLSLPRKHVDHQKMFRFYEKMSARLEQYGQTEELLTVLAREELIENGNWCSYQRDNKPDISF